MKNHSKALFSLFVASLLLVGCSSSDVEVNVATEKTPIASKELPTMILIKTTQGDIKIELDAEKAPNTVANFMKYVESGHYSDTIFHRVIDNFMIQGGGFNAKMAQKNAPHTVDNEANNGLKNDRGTIAMARTSDPHSAGAQFFINVKDNDFLNFSAPTQQGWGYCVFGKVVEGLDVVDAIKGVATGAQDVPKEAITIINVQIIGEPSLKTSEGPVSDSSKSITSDVLSLHNSNDARENHSRLYNWYSKLSTRLKRDVVKMAMKAKKHPKLNEFLDNSKV